MKNQKSLKILGKTYVIKYCKVPEDRFGDCDHPNTPNRKIRICETLKGKEQLSVTVHELLHSVAFDLFSEEWVQKAGEDLGNALWELGYRKIETARKRNDKTK